MIIGVDPGLSGAVCCLTNEGNFEFVFDLPIIRDKKLAWIDGLCLSRYLEDSISTDTTAIVERVASRPGMSSVAVFTFGVGFGSILGVLRALECQIEFVTPPVWKKHYGLGKDKAESLQKARLLFPTADLALKKNEGRAEALLIAKWYANERRSKKEA